LIIEQRLVWVWAKVVDCSVLLLLLLLLVEGLLGGVDEAVVASGVDVLTLPGVSVDWELLVLLVDESLAR